MNTKTKESPSIKVMRLKEQLKSAELELENEKEVVKRGKRKVTVAFSEATIEFEGKVDVTIDCVQLADGNWWPATESDNDTLYDVTPSFIQELRTLALKHGVTIKGKKFNITDMWDGNCDSIRLSTGERLETW